jgi:hypothetical protein
VNDTYFADASRRLEAIASPLFDAQLALALPATLIMTGEDDTLAPETPRGDVRAVKDVRYRTVQERGGAFHMASSKAGLFATTQQRTHGARSYSDGR